MNNSILIKSDSRYPLDRKQIRQAINQDLQQEHNLRRPVEISLNIVGKRKMKSLNKSYRQIDKPTNVLSFPLKESPSDQQNPPDGPDDYQGFVFPPDKFLYLGDIIICYPVARQQAADYNLMVNDWISELAVHGLQHLLGIHHS